MLIRRTDKHKYFICLFLLLMIDGMAGIGHSATITTPSSCPATLPSGTVGVAYSYEFMGTGGTGNPWSITSGSLPPGLALTNSTRTYVYLSGTPTTQGTYTFTIQYRGTPTVSCQCTVTIAGVCSFVSGISNGTISFGNIDPSSASNIYGTVSQQVSFTCVTKPSYTITVTPSSGWTLTSGSNTISYTLGVAPSGTYSGTAVNLLIAPPSTSASSITPANFQNAPAGTYSNASAISISVNYGTGTLTASLPTGNVTGTVIPICAVSQSPGTLTFNINPSITGTTSGTISPDMQIKCTKNDSFSIAAASSCGGLSQTYPPTCGGSIIPYTFGFSPGYSSGQGFGVAIPMNISGSVSSTNYQNAPVGNYGDLRTLTITY
jgi:hypothetical protein